MSNPSTDPTGRNGLPPAAQDWHVPPAINPQEINAYRAHAYSGMILGVVIIFLALGLAYARVNFASAMQLLGTIFWIYSGWFLAKSRGYHPAWGLLGFIGIIGLLALSLFPDRYQIPPDATTRQLQLVVRILLVLLILAGIGFIMSR